MAIVAVYEDLKRRRGLEGGFFDFPPAHFERIAHLESAAFFRVSGANGVAGMACGIVFDSVIHLVHLAISDDGLRKGASYLLMWWVLDLARSHGLLVALGGLPRGADEGLKRFKARWSNRRSPVYLLRLVNDRPTYEAMTDGLAASIYFPAYRTPAANGLPQLAAIQPDQRRCIADPVRYC